MTTSVAPEKPVGPIEEVLDATEIKQRAAGGAVLVAARGAGIQALSFCANIVLARLLVPADFGLVALGNTIVVFGDLIANQGLSTALIRTPTTPELEDLRAVTGFQLGITLLLLAGVVAIALPLGRAGELSAVMSIALPALAMRSAPAVMLERSLAYRKLVTVEISESVIYVAWAVGTVVAGFGVWGLATGVVVRVLAGTSILNAIAPVGWVRPALSLSRLRPLLDFGLRSQATSGLNFVRDQLFNIAIAAASSVSALGLWSLASRALAIPTILFEALWRVAYPAMSRLMALGEDARAIVERSVGMVATAGTAPLCALAGSAPALVPAVFGHKWAGGADALPAACLGMMIVGPVSVSCSGFLAARGDAGTMLRGAVLHTFAQFAIAVPLLPILHLWGVGFGVLAACLVEATVLGRRSAQVTGARVLRPIAGPVIAGVAAGGLGWMMASSMPRTVPVGVLAGAVSFAAYAVIAGLIPGNMVLTTLGTMRRAVAAAR